MRSVLACAGLLLALAVAGCLEGPDGPTPPPTNGDVEPGPDEGPTNPEGGGNPTTTVEDAVVLDGVLQMTDCRWLNTIHDYPGSTNPAPVPAWWNADDQSPLTSNALRMFQCDAFGFEEFDRPVTLLLESSNKGVPPEDCFEDREGRIMVHVLNLFVDDEEVAQRLQERYEAPVQLAEFTVEADATGTIWSWAAGGDFSRLTYSFNETDEPFPKSGLRVLWETQNGTLRLDLDFDLAGPAVTSRAATGQLAGAHWATSYPGGTFVGAAGAGDDGSVSGRMTRLGPACAPLS